MHCANLRPCAASSAAALPDGLTPPPADATCCSFWSAPHPLSAATSTIIGTAISRVFPWFITAPLGREPPHQNGH
jgi:hypothetical protein